MTLLLSMTGLNTYWSRQILRIPDPATIFREYAKLVYEDYKALGPPVHDHSVSTALHNEGEPRESVSMHGQAKYMTIEARRELARTRTQRKSEFLKAAQSGNVDEVDILLDEDYIEVDWMAPVDGKTALQLAAQYGHSKVATILLAHKANIEARCEHIGTQWENKLWLGRTPLIWAAAGQKTSGSRQEAMVKLLLDRGADMTARSHTHRTALQEAVMSILHNNDPRNTVRMLLDRGALVNAFDIEGWTALSEAACPTSEAARRGLDALELHRELALELLRHGATVEGRPPISDPAYRSNPISEGPPNKPLLLTGRDHLSKIPTDRIVELLLDYSANFNARLAMGEALIHVAARQGKPIVVLKLLGAGCEVDIKDTSNGDTPLHKAASKGQNDVIQALLKRGASVRAENDLGQDARQQALSHGHKNAAEVLAKHMQTHEK